jgi:hypothetical protein
MTGKIIFIIIAAIAVSSKAEAQVLDIAAIIKAGISKVIRATDLEVQRLQTETIELQNIQQELQNEMTQTELNEISGWVQRQEALYQEYYTELWQVKKVIANYDKVKDIITLQAKINSEYNSAYSLFKQDKNFSASELDWMSNVYDGILSESLKNVEQVLLVVNAFVTQMSDENRMKIIDNAAAGIQKNYNDLKHFNSQNIQLSLQHAAENNDVGTVKALYGLE